MKICANCGTILRFPKTWWSGCYHCGFSVDLTDIVNKIQKEFGSRQIERFLEVVNRKFKHIDEVENTS